MAKTSPNLGLILPAESENFNISTWNRNMRILDDAYALLTDPQGGSSPIPAVMIRYDNTASELDATNVQEAVDSLAGTLIDGNTYEVYVDQNITLTIATWAHIYLILHFGETVPTVNFVQSLPDSGIDFRWEGGHPSFQPNSTYELSFLRLDCMWFKRR